MKALFIILYVIMMVVAAACYLIGYSHASAERRARRHTIPQNDWRYGLDDGWANYQAKEIHRKTASQGEP